MVVPLAAEPGPDETFLRAEDVILAVEVVSPDSEARDRETKPRKYAAARSPPHPFPSPPPDGNFRSRTPPGK